MADMIKLMKQNVLDLAIKGKLVEQLPEEGTAEELLLKISKEREQLITDNKIGKESEPPFDFKEEVPFNIPKSWKWVKLSELFEITSSKRVMKKDWRGEGIPFFRARELVLLNKDGVVNNDLFIEDSLYKEFKEKFGVPQTHDIMVTGVGTIGVPYVVREVDEFYFKDATILWFKNIHKLNPFYIKYVIESDFFHNRVIEESKGTTVATYTITRAKKDTIPIPPLNEQKRIVSKIEEIFSIIDQIAERKEDALQTIQLIRQTTLQQAIQGKLVEQNEQDEPASELLIKIHEEKEQLIEKGEIRKQTKLPKVKTEELPFEIPSNWRWARIGNIINEIFGGGTPSKSNPLFWNGDIPWASVKDISKDDIYLETTIDSITENGFENCSGKMIDVGDIIVITRMGLGRIVISNISTAINQDLKGIKLSSQIVPKYFLYAYKNNDIKGTGTTVKGITQKDLLNTLIPVPPRAEQEKIVKKIEQVMNICDQMEELFK